jgi:hypothetical protein
MAFVKVLLVACTLALALGLAPAAGAKKAKKDCKAKCEELVQKCMEMCEKAKGKSNDPEFVYKCREKACKEMAPAQCMKRCEERRKRRGQ